jgi:hypothetical protein
MAYTLRINSISLVDDVRDPTKRVVLTDIDAARRARSARASARRKTRAAYDVDCREFVRRAVIAASRYADAHERRLVFASTRVSTSDEGPLDFFAFVRGVKRQASLLEALPFRRVVADCETRTFTFHWSGRPARPLVKREATLRRWFTDARPSQ